MSYYLELITFGTTGVKTRPVPFTPKGMKITVAKKGSSANTVVRFSEGSSDGINQKVNSIYQDSTGSQTESSNAKIVSAWERVSGTLTEVVSAKVDNAVNPWTATDVVFEVTATNNSYQFMIEVWG